MSENTKKTMAFTIDQEDGATGEVPSITRLLNRKKLGLPSPATAASPPPATPEMELASAQPIVPPPNLPTFTPPPPSFELGSAATPLAPDSSVEPKITPSSLARRSKVTASALPFSEFNQLQNRIDPMAKVIEKMVGQGATAVLCMAPTVSTPQPRFEAKEAFGSSAWATLCSGLRWDTSWTTNLWHKLNGQGVIDLPPTDNEPAPQTLRAALGIEPSQHLCLVRLGSATACTGILAFVAPQSMIGELTASKQVFGTLKAA